MPSAESIQFQSVATNESAALILFEDGKPEIERAARAIAERLEGQGRGAKVKCASSVEISEILASGLFLFGADSSAPPSYAELARVFKGVNLAGRKVAFFGSSGAAVAGLRALCADTEVTVAHSDFVGRPEPAALATWLKSVLASS
jgi:flavorubredoxin